MDKMMDNPWFLRITALLLAFLLYFSVQAESNDTSNSAETGTIDEVIEDVELEVYYDNSNLMVSGVPETVDLHIAGPPSMVQTTRQIRDFSVFVDLREMTLGRHRVQVQTENLSERLTVRVNPDFLNVTIEERVTEEFRIDPEMNERLLAEGYVIDSISATPETVSVTGPQSVINAISFVKASVTREGEVSESFTTEANVRVLASDLSKLDDVTIEPETVGVTVEVEEYSQEVPVSLEQTGTPAEGITIDSLKVSNDTVRIFGPRNAVDQLKEYVVEVDTDAIAPSKTKMEIELAPPSGTTSVAPGELTVEAGITVDETAWLPGEPVIPEMVSDASPSSRVFLERPLEVRGLSEDLEATVLEPEDGRFSLTVMGETTSLWQLTEEDFVLYAEARDERGEQELAVAVEGSDQFFWQVSPADTILKVE